jgi:hypothetical protein
LEEGRRHHARGERQVGQTDDATAWQLAEPFFYNQTGASP